MGARPRQEAHVRLELFSGGSLLGVAALLGFVVSIRTGPNWMDAVGFRLFPADVASKWAPDVTNLGSVPVLVIGVTVLGVVALVRRDWVRALSCVIGPVGAVLTVQLVAKPLVARHFEGSLTYPSGTVAAVAALAMGGFLLAPGRAKPVVAVVAGGAVAAICAAVITLRWHYPTDVLGGICVGMGIVLLLDGILLLYSGSDRIRRWRQRRMLEDSSNNASA
jgi:membrane-associated phospholipid phosphatase